MSVNRRDYHAAAASDARSEAWTVFAYAPSARASAVSPPAAAAGSVGVFGGRGATVAVASPLARKSGFEGDAAASPGVVGCAYGGTSSRGAALEHRVSRGAGDRLGWFECLLAPDPFIEGFFPVLVDGADAAGAGGRSLGGSAPQIEYVAAPHVASWRPEIAHVGGGGLVVVTGADLGGGFRGAGALACVFAAGPRAAASGAAGSGSGSGSGSSSTGASAPSVALADAVSSAVAVCEIPGDLPEGVAALTVGLAGSAPMSESAAPLALTPPPEARHASPKSGGLEGGFAVTVVGSRLAPVSGADDLSARVGTIAPVALRPGAGADAAEFLAPARYGGAAEARVGRSMSDAAGLAPVAVEYRKPFVAEAGAATPGVVAVAGGASVRVFGSGVGSLPRWMEEGDLYAEETGSGAGAAATRVAAHVARLRVPAKLAGGFVAFEVASLPGLSPGALDVGSLPQLLYRRAARVLGAYPSAVTPGGAGSVLDVWGEGFVAGETATRLGEFGAAAHAVVSSALIRAEAHGAHHHDTRAPVEVAASPDAASDPNAWSSEGTLVAFHRLPRATRADPPRSSEDGGTACDVTGADFRDAGDELRCKFASVVVAAAGFAGMNAITCVAPARAPSDEGTLSVSVNGRDFGAAVPFYAAPRVEVLGLDPTRGPATGGTEVTIHGAGFVPVDAGGAWRGGTASDALATTVAGETPRVRSFGFACRFDASVVPASVAGGRGVAANRATCRSPPHAMGFVAVEVSAGTGNFTSFGLMFEYQAPAAPEVLFPAAGAAAGGTLVTVAGANFIASSQHWSYGHGNVAQPGSGGGVTVGSSSEKLAGVDALQCRFGGGYAVGASAVSSAVLRCETPAFAEFSHGRALATDVSINAGENYAEAAATYFEPLADATVLSLSPRAGTCGGGTVVNVRGAGFTADEPVWCFFGTTGPIRAEYADEGTVRCKSPAKASNDVPLEVARGNTFDLSRNSVMFSI